ncbi:MAG: response regulator [Nanoarchaeota archaeon]
MLFPHKLSSNSQGENPGVEVEAVWDGNKLVEKVQQQDYGVIITDYNMGIRSPNGLEASKSIRKAGVQTPIYLHSTNNFDSVDVRSSGVTKVFSKDNNSKDLVDAVAELYKDI